MKLKNEKGAALVLALFVFFFLTSYSTLFILRTAVEKKATVINTETMKSFYLAEAGIYSGIDRLDTLINNYMNNNLTDLLPEDVINTVAAYVTSGDSLGFLEWAIQNEGVPQVTVVGNGVEHVMSTEFGPDGANGIAEDGEYAVTITITEKNPPVQIGTDEWDFSFNYKIQSRGAYGGLNYDIDLDGDFELSVERDNFVRFAQGTYEQASKDGEDVYLTSRSYFDGPIHTNGSFKLMGMPAGTVIHGNVTQSQNLVEFFNDGFPFTADQSSNPGVDEMQVSDGSFVRGVRPIQLGESNDRLETLVAAGETYTETGVYLPNNGAALTGGIYVNGRSMVDLSVDVSNRQVYTFNQGQGLVNKITIDRAAQQTIVENQLLGTTQVYDGLPDGTEDRGTVIFVKGVIQGLQGTVQESEEITMGTWEDIRITGNIEYAAIASSTGSPWSGDYVPPDIGTAVNVLGLVAFYGDIIIAQEAPDNVKIHAAMFSRYGEIFAEGHNDLISGPKGDAEIYGSVVTSHLGGFGTYDENTNTLVAGYGKIIVHDSRMEVKGYRPPNFPSMRPMIAFSNDIDDHIAWQDKGSSLVIAQAEE